jgi:hypothetical protein
MEDQSQPVEEIRRSLDENKSDVDQKPTEATPANEAPSDPTNNESVSGPVSQSNK